MENGRPLFKMILWILPALMWSPAVAFSQSQSDAPPSSRASQQSSSQTQAQQPQKEEKGKVKPKKVYTKEDLAGLRGNGVSVVGDDKPAGDRKSTRLNSSHRCISYAVF